MVDENGRKYIKNVCPSRSPKHYINDLEKNIH
jgi:hypothetical protein